ncbi:MAG TPA: oxidoreductase, partial [Candidatus Angelobacter sp.]
WASGTGGTVIRTIDGGKNWSVQTVAGAEQLDFRGIRAFDENTAVIISSGPAEKGQARIYRTTDGGRNWQQVFEEKRAGIFFDAIAFWDRQHGIVLSDPVDGKFALFTTEDGGASWKQLAPAALPAALPSEGAFAASNSCLVVQGRSNVWFATGGASAARVFRSNDRGKTWQVSETPLHPQNASSGIFSLAFPTSKSGVAVGGDYQHPESSDLPNVLATEDGGKTWRAEKTNPPGMYLSSVASVWHPGKDSLLAAGINGLLHGDGGFPLDKKESDANLNAVAGTGANIRISWWAVGPKGIVLRRTKLDMGNN